MRQAFEEVESIEQQKRDEESRKFARQNLRNIYADLFLAGSETTSSALKWAMLFMVLNPDIQKRVQVGARINLSN